MAFETVQTEYGTVSGMTADGCLEFRGIPFAAPPVGELTFRHPVKPDSWEGVYKATSGRANPVQRANALGAKNNSRDCLYLNIFRPEDADEILPVMVWIYGGSFANGGTGAAEPGSDKLDFDPAIIARDTKTVVVSFNYRVNLYGFLNLSFLGGGFDVNNGLYDQIMALQFVHDNIAQFGGDPDNVTVFGQSAGAASILALMAMEDARGLFHKAVVMSANADHFHTPAESEFFARKYLKIIGISESDPKALYDLDPVRVGRANQRLQYSFYRLRLRDMRCAFSPVIDGDGLKDIPKEAARRSEIPLIIGNTAEEANLFTSRVPAFAEAILIKCFRIPMIPGKGSFREHASASVTEQIYKKPINEILNGRHGPSWRYEFCYVTQYARQKKMGCYHASDVPLLFGRDTRFGKISGPDEERIGAGMRAVLGSFAEHGNPGWEEYSLNRNIFRQR